MAGPNIFSFHLSCVAASCIFQSAAEFANNSVICHSEEQSDEESVTFPKIDSSMTIMTGMSRRLCSLSDTEDLALGPARAESATPAAGPGENLGGHSVGARSATAGCLRASAAQGCGPHGSRSRPLHRHSLQKPLFRFLYGIHLSDCSLRLLRATATVRRESWRRSVRSANVGLRPRMLPMPLMPATWLSRRARHVPWTPMELMRTDSPCAASKHLHVKLLFFYYI